MSGTNEYLLERASVIDLIDFLIDTGTKIYLQNQYKNPDDDFNFRLFSDIEDRGQLFCLNPIFSDEIPVLRPVDNIHSGRIYMIDNDLQEGFFEVSIRRRADNFYVVSMGCRNFFSKIGGLDFFPPKPELKHFYRVACRQMKKLAIKTSRKTQ
jgi:hypothetical protein